MLVLLNIKGAENVCLFVPLIRIIIMSLPQSEWFLLGLHSSWVVPPWEQFVCIVLECREYYKEKCMWHTATYSCYSICYI